MKTTIEINDTLVHRAKVHAAERETTLRAIVEAALGQYLNAPAAERQSAFRLRRCSFGGQGLQPGLDERDWSSIRALIYEGRGG